MSVFYRLIDTKLMANTQPFKVSLIYYSTRVQGPYL